MDLRYEASDDIDPVDRHVGQRLKQRRKELKISQSDLGRVLSMSFQQVQKYERGVNRISASKLFRAAYYLSVPIVYFFQGMPVSMVRSIWSAIAETLPGTIERDLNEAPRNQYRSLVAAFDSIGNAELRERVVEFVERTASDAARAQGREM